MRRSAFTIFVMVLVLTFSCDSIDGTFDDSVPNFYSLTTNVSPEQGGTVQPSAGEFLEGNSVQIVARPEEGYVFDIWEGDLTGSSNPAVLRFTSNRTVTAHFSLRDYDLNIEIVGNGVVNETVDERSPTSITVTLTAEAEEGWIFHRWEGDLSGNSNPETIVMDNDKNVTAIFEVDVDFGITINEVKFYIIEMELGGARRTRDFKTKDFILNVPVDGTPFHITHVQIPAGFYDVMELDIAKPTDSVSVDDPDFRDESGSYSLVVHGVFNGIDFTFRSDEDFQIDVDFEPHLEIKRGQTSVIAITVDFEGWFKGDNGEFLDPNDPQNAERINKNIEDSFSDFEDEF
jgi:hypothetical protein